VLVWISEDENVRLTLRAMLAYLDEHCDWSPADKADFGKRIEESKYASDLVERIRVSLRRPRLGAPKVEGRGIGLDANTVAEYIEGTLPAERIADFEKLCLESDVHLAEVAACHEILSDVVAGIRPPIQFGLKETVYALGSPDGEERFRRARTQANKASAAAAMAASGASTLASDGGHLLAPPVNLATGGGLAEPPVASAVGGESVGTMPWRGMALALGFAFLLVLGGLRWLGPFDGRHPLARWGRDGDIEVAKADPASPSEGAAKAERSGTNGEQAASPQDADTTSDDRDAASGKGLPAPHDANDKADAAAVEPAANLPDEPAKPGAKGVTKDTESEKVGDGAVRPKSAPAAPQGGAVRAAVVASPEEPLGAAAKKAGNRNVAAKGGDDPTAEPMPPTDAPIEVARLVSEEQVLARIDSRDGLWYRLIRGTPLSTAQTYVALPFYRPQILVPNSTQVMVVGPAAFSLIAPTAGEMGGGMGGGGVSLDRGRAILATAGMPGTRVPLSLAGQRGVLLFGDANAELAVEIRRYLPPGAEPDEVAARVTRLFFTRRGTVEWHPDGGDPIRIAADQVLEISDGEEPTIESSVFPAWSEVRNVSKLDRDAFEQLETLLSPERPLTLTLEELHSFRKTEIRSLAARSLASIGEFDSLIRELANDQQHSYWDRAVDDLREALAQGPDEARRVQEAFQRIRIEDSKVLYRMLRDYSPEQLARDGGAAELIGFLDHKALDVRVMAFETLRRITGVTLYYRPEASVERRRVPMQKWRERLKDGQVVHKTLPASPPVVERKPASKSAEPAKP